MRQCSLPVARRVEKQSAFRRMKRLANAIRSPSGYASLTQPTCFFEPCQEPRFACLTARHALRADGSRPVASQGLPRIHATPGMTPFKLSPRHNIIEPRPFGAILIDRMILILIAKRDSANELAIVAYRKILAHEIAVVRNCSLGDGIDA